MRWHSILRYAAATLAGVAFGAGTAWLAISAGATTVVSDSPEWKFERLAGSTQAGAYTRARIARTGLLALDRSEAVYYLADTDEAGEPLVETCDYIVRGRPLTARWWSLTLYDQDRFLARNDDDAASVAGTALSLDADGAWAVRVARDRLDSPAWLSTRNAGHFSLALRLYQPPSDLVAMPESAELPRIQRGACTEGG